MEVYGATGYVITVASDGCARALRMNPASALRPRLAAG